MATDHPVFAGDPNHFLDTRQAFNFCLIERCYITDHINLGECAVGASNAVRSGSDAGFTRQVRHYGFSLGGIERAIRAQDYDHAEVPVAMGTLGSLPHSDQEPA